MKKIIVTENPAAFPLDGHGVEVVSAQQYLTEPGFARTRRTRVFNLCREYSYQSRGYYVSLLAEARGHKVIPSVKTIQDLKTPTLVKIIGEDLDVLIRRSLRHITSQEFVLSIYFGENVAKQHLKLSQALYRLFQAPLLRARFVKKDGWELQHVRAIPLSEIPESHLPFVREAARRYFGRKRYDPARARTFVYDLAILVNPEEKAPPSDKRALSLFAEAAERLGFWVEFVGKDDFSRLSEFDALFLRETTAVNHHTYRFARRAQSEGLAVMDDPDAILRCANKVYLAELLQNARLPTPKTLIVHADNRREVEQQLGLPCVLKLPDSSFSLGVERVETPAALEAQLNRMLNASDLVIAQAYMPSDFDWRIGVLDGRPLFACKYYMAEGHWQIYNWNGKTWDEIEGEYETLPVEAVPAYVMDAALKATRLLGDGLFGVDLKEVDGRAYLIEINDNPNIDGGVEDKVLKDRLYTAVMQALKDRIEKQRGLREVP